MTKDEIFAFLNANPLVYLATTEDGVPHVRGMMLFRADESGIYFHTGKGKEMTNQLEQQPVAELCVFNQQDGVQVRVSGTVEFLGDLALKQQLVAERPFLQPIVEQFGYEAFVVFRLAKHTATVWTMAENMAPKTYTQLS